MDGGSTDIQTISISFGCFSGGRARPNLTRYPPRGRRIPYNLRSGRRRRFTIEFFFLEDTKPLVGQHFGDLFSQIREPATRMGESRPTRVLVAERHFGRTSGLEGDGMGRREGLMMRPIMRVTFTDGQTSRHPQQAIQLDRGHGDGVMGIHSTRRALQMSHIFAPCLPVPNIYIIHYKDFSGIEEVNN